MLRLVLFCLLPFLAATAVFSQADRPFSIEGHRGARGWAPENTIHSFKKALLLGADTLELDVVVTKDGKILVSHEAWFSSAISLDPSGNRIPEDKQKEFNIFRMSYEETRLFDVGSIGNKNFPEQEKMKASKPLLQDVFREIASFVRENKLPEPRYNIEIKTVEDGDDVFNPKPATFARLVYDEIKAQKMLKRVIVQSFDARVLREMRGISKRVPLAFLVSNKRGVTEHLEALGFDPDTYSPNFSLVSAEMITTCRKRRIKIVPWTVNEVADMERMRSFDLDGIITDYPDRAMKVFRKDVKLN